MRVLLLLSQMPQDPSSGAARSMRTICELLARCGIEVAALATTATEQAAALEPVPFLSAAGHQPTIERLTCGFRVLRFSAKKVAYTLLDVFPAGPMGWNLDFGGGFDILVDQALRTFQPDVVFTYGGLPHERRRRRWVRKSGSAVIFGLRNFAYLHPDDFADVDAVLSASAFLAARYRHAVGLESTVLPLPIDLTETVAPQRDPVFVTYINPTIEKGLMFFARLAEELGRRRPDVPMLVVESRALAGSLVSAGLAGGFDLRRHESLMTCPAASRPADIFATARVLLAPSVWVEPAGRVAVEALVNGVPPIVSDRGGLPEVCRGGGFVLPLPAELNLSTDRPVAAEAVGEWMALIERLCDDETFYADAAKSATNAGRYYDSKVVAPQYAAFFERVVRDARAHSSISA